MIFERLQKEFEAARASQTQGNFPWFTFSEIIFTNFPLLVWHGMRSMRS